MTPARYDLKRRMGVVPQQVAVFDELTVRENIDYFCSLYVSDRKRRSALVDEAIDFVGLGDFAKFRPGKLSGRPGASPQHRLRHRAQARAHLL